MPYATAQSLIDRYGEPELVQLADRDGDGGWEATVVDRVLADTDAESDAALAARYPLPLATVPALLVGLACDIARCRLHVDGVPDHVRDAAANARKILAALSAGTMSLGLPAASEPASTGLARVSSGDAVFSSAEGF